MARGPRYNEAEKWHAFNLPCPIFDSTPFVKGTVLSEARVALITTAGLHRSEDRPFVPGENGYRLIPGDSDPNQLVMSHVSSNFDRSGFILDVNTLLPIDRLNELVEQGKVGSVAQYHYSFMGQTDPTLMEVDARALAAILKQDHVNAVLLIPV